MQAIIDVGMIPGIAINPGTSVETVLEMLQVVAASEWHEQILSEFEHAGLMSLFKGFSSPGVNRQLSISGY